MPFALVSPAKPRAMFVAKHFVPAVRMAPRIAEVAPQVGARHVSAKAAKATKKSEDTVHTKQVVEQVATKSGIVATDVDTIVRSVLELIEETVAKGGKVQFTGAR